MARSLTLILTALVAALLSVPTPTQERQVGSLTWTPTRFETREGRKQTVPAEAGTLVVAENWAMPGGRTMTLRLVRFRATTSTPGAPIVYLAGGPGGSGILSAAGDRFPLFMQLREAADVIALDQRGVRSDPFPSCPSAFQLPLDQPAGREAWLPVLRSAARTCVAKWNAAGLDLSQLDASASARDLEALRQALGVAKLNLLGISFGTHLGLAAMRAFPELADRAVMAGVEGPDDTLKLPSAADAHLAALAAVIDASPSRRGRPRVLDQFKTVAQRLATPVEVDVRASGQNVKVTIGLADLQMATLEQSTERADIEALPARIDRMAGGDLTELGRWAVERRSLRGLLPMAYISDCASGASSERLSRIRREATGSLMGDAINLPFPDVCDAWPARDAGDVFRSPVRSTVPALFISGSLDGRTPLANARGVMAGFPNGRELLLDPAGHDDDLLIATPEIGRIITAFFRGQPPATSRLALPPLNFGR